MVIVQASARTTLSPAVRERSVRASATPPPSVRDTGMDLARAACVCVVVLLHALMVGVTLTETGPSFRNAAEGADWFAPVTWIAQVMPLFFVIGGFAGASAYRRHRRAGRTASAFVAGRVQRLVLPATLSVAAMGAGLAALGLAGAPAELIEVAGFRYGQPLWFLGVFLGCQALLPVLLAAHDRAPARTIAALAGAALLVDLLRAATGADAWGFLNLAFVWLALQQLGFFLADGHLDALPRPARLLLASGSAILLCACMIGGVFSPDLIANLNPPTTALLLVGLAQASVLSLLRRPLNTASAHPLVARVSGFITARTMTIYLWHMPVLLAMAGITALYAAHTGMTLPALSSTDWWLGRPLWLLLALLLTAGVATLAGGGERRASSPSTPSAARTAQSVLASVGGVVLLLVAGTSALTAGVAVALFLVALARVRAPQSSPAPRSRERRVLMPSADRPR